MMNPRVLRQRDAYKYLGMCQDIFNKLVRPFVTVLKIGDRGIGYDRYELDEWFDEYKKDEHNIKSNKRPGRQTCQNTQDYISVAKNGTLTSKSAQNAFDKALEQIMKEKQ